MSTPIAAESFLQKDPFSSALDVNVPQSRHIARIDKSTRRKRRHDGDGCMEMHFGRDEVCISSKSSFYHESRTPASLSIQGFRVIFVQALHSWCMTLDRYTCMYAAQIGDIRPALLGELMTPSGSPLLIHDVMPQTGHGFDTRPQWG